MSLSNVKYTQNFAAGLRFITSVSFTGASSVNIDNCFSSKYQHYLIMRDISSSAALNGIHVRLRSSGTDESGANYRRQQTGAYSTTTYGARYIGDTGFLVLLGYTETTSMGFASAWISNPFESVKTTGYSNQSYQATGDIWIQSQTHTHDLANSYTGMTVYPGAGTITGTIYVYGLRESK